MSIKFKSLERHIREKTKKPKTASKYEPGNVYISKDFSSIFKVKQDFSRTQIKIHGLEGVFSKCIISRNYHKAKNDQEILDACEQIYFNGKGPVPGFESIFAYIEDTELRKLILDFNDLIKSSDYYIKSIVTITFDFFKKLPKYIDPDKFMNMIDQKKEFFS